MSHSIKGLRKYPSPRANGGMKDLVSILNTIPFIAIQDDACEGELKTQRDTFTADTGYTFMEEGNIEFKISRRYALAEEFLKELENLHSIYPFVKLDEHHCGDDPCAYSMGSWRYSRSHCGCVLKGSKFLQLTYGDLIHPERIHEIKDWCDKNMEKTPKSLNCLLNWYKENIRFNKNLKKANHNDKQWEQLQDILWKNYKATWQVPVAIGKKRIDDYQRVWSDCKDIAIKYYRLAKARGYTMDDHLLTFSPNEDNLRKLLEKQE